MNNTDFILRGGRVVDPSGNIDAIFDLGVSAGKLTDPRKLENSHVIDVGGLVVTPGLIDMHVHLRQPGKPEKETIRSGSMAAAAGGFTSILAMPNTSPPTDSTSTIEYVRRHAEREAVVKILTSACITKNQEGKEMTGIGAMKRAGISALTDDGKCVHNHELMRHVLEYSKSFSLPILDHCEDESLSGEGVMHEGYWSLVLGLRGMPAAAEEVMVARDIILAEMANWKMHIQHVSSAGSIRMIRDARRRGVPVSCEVTPHHLALTDESLKDFDTNFKVNPPLRSQEHRLAIIEGLRDGTVDAIASDHAPHTDTEKLVEFDFAPFGLIGLETTLPVCLTELFHKKIISLPDLIAKFTSGPASILDIDSGTLKEGAAADITIIDPEKEFVIDPDRFMSKSRNTPFGGYKAKGKAVATIVNGKFIYSEIPGVNGMIP